MGENEYKIQTNRDFQGARDCQVYQTLKLGNERVGL